MDSSEIFFNFLESFKDQNPALIEAIQDGFVTMLEAKQPAIRTRPNPSFHAEDDDVTDNKDHFPLGSVKQARNAISREG